MAKEKLGEGIYSDTKGWRGSDPPERTWILTVNKERFWFGSYMICLGIFMITVGWWKTTSTHE